MLNWIEPGSLGALLLRGEWWTREVGRGLENFILGVRIAEHAKIML